MSIEPELVGELPRHLYTFHGCGLGEYLTAAQTRAVIATRLTSLCKGFSGISVETLDLSQTTWPAGARTGARWSARAG